MSKRRTHSPEFKPRLGIAGDAGVAAMIDRRSAITSNSRRNTVLGIFCWSSGPFDQWLHLACSGGHKIGANRDGLMSCFMLISSVALESSGLSQNRLSQLPHDKPDILEQRPALIAQE
jgi:hypothetical protein